MLRCAIFAPVNNAEDAFGQAATHAPQAMHDAASIARSDVSLLTRIAFPSGALPVETEIYPPAAMIRSNELRSTTRSLMGGKAAARHGSITSSSPSLKC